MKMIMPLKATESGAVKHRLSTGSIITAGDLLASLTLKDPSKVRGLGLGSWLGPGKRATLLVALLA